MRVALSVDALSPELTGIGRYCWELASLLPAQPDVGDVRYFAGPHWYANPATLLRPRIAKQPRWLRKSLRWIGKHGLDALRRPKVDVVHGPNFLLPEWGECGIVTVHDLSVFRFPETHPPERVAALERDFDCSTRRAAHIITPSETIRQEVIAFTGRSPESVTAVYNGVGDLRPLSAEERWPHLRRLGLPVTGYGLTLSALEPRKRIESLIDAWEGLPSGIRNVFPLVIAGAKGWRNQALHEKMERAAGQGWLIPLSFVSEDALAALYSGASLFVYPSIYEGFGLPPIEAMACGVPTVVADASCLPEVTGGAAMLTAPDDLPGFTTDLHRALTDNWWRAEASSAGLQIARQYSWDRCTRETVAVYGKVLNSNSRNRLDAQSSQVSPPANGS